MSEFAKFQALHKRFASLIESDEGPSKSTSGDIELYIKCPFSYLSAEPKIWIKFNGYDIGDWSRNEEWGPFACLTEVNDFLLLKVEEAEELLKQES